MNANPTSHLHQHAPSKVFEKCPSPKCPNPPTLGPTILILALVPSWSANSVCPWTFESSSTVRSQKLPQSGAWASKICKNVEWKHRGVRRRSVRGEHLTSCFCLVATASDLHLQIISTVPFLGILHQFTFFCDSKALANQRRAHFLADARE